MMRGAYHLRQEDRESPRLGYEEVIFSRSGLTCRAGFAIAGYSPEDESCAERRRSASRPSGLALGGCGTAVNCAGVRDGGAPKQIYGGVALDRRWSSHFFGQAFHGPCAEDAPWSKKLLAGSFAFGCGVGVLAVDLPLSAILDTLTLPLTVPATIRKWNWAINAAHFDFDAGPATEAPPSEPRPAEPRP